MNFVYFMGMALAATTIVIAYFVRLENKREEEAKKKQDR